MARPRLFWQLLPTYLLVILVALAAVIVYSRHAIREFHYERVRADLDHRAALVHQRFAEHSASEQASAIHALCDRLAASSATRVTFIRHDGTVLGDSHENPAMMDNHAERPEVREALAGRAGSSIRFSQTVQRPMIYAALPLEGAGDWDGVVRVALPLHDVESALSRILVNMSYMGLAAALLAILIGLALARYITRPIREITSVTEQFARGDFSRRVPPVESRELGDLADSINWVAQQLDEKAEIIQRQRAEESAILANMTEGLIALDVYQHVISLNGAAARLLGVDPQQAAQRSIQEVVRNVDLQRFIERVFASGGLPQEGDIVIYDREPTFLQAHGTIMKDGAQRMLGALVVLHDVTRLRRLENVRRDFVANVSHELKTPITTIKGFVETLQAGALNDPPNARRFLDIIARHADRLTSIIEDLLSLSRLEQEKERGTIERKMESVRKILLGAADACGPLAESRKVEVAVACEEDLRASVNAPLLQQAVVNLVDNAIKYSPERSRVDIRGSMEGGDVVLVVEDRGPGIAQEHLPRLFERFYRVDKARSREVGGTGLGLAIVKHIAQAHQGRATVESQVGRGSRFCIRFPAQPNGNGQRT